jgi:CRP-like cAMP-binding protein
MANENVKQYEAGELIFAEGDPGKQMYVLLDGAVDIKIKVDRGETVIKTVDTPNDFFGEMALLDERPRSASAVAAKATKVLMVDGPTFEAMILSNGKFALKIIKILAARIRRSNDQVSDLIDTMPKDRIARGMTDFAINHGERIHEGAIKTNIEAMKAWINGRLGASMEEIELAIYRLLKSETISWAPTSVKTKEFLLLSADFIKANDRRTKEGEPDRD